MTEISIAELNEIMKQSFNFTITNDKTTEGVNWLDNKTTLNIYNVKLTGSGTLLNQAKSADLTGLDVSEITNIRYLFSGCAMLKSLDVSNWDVSNVTDMSGMFDSCMGLTSLDLSNWNTSNVTNMSRMFSGSGLTSLDLSSFDTSNVTDMNQMFYLCKFTSLDLSSWNTSNVTNMTAMFTNCSKLTSLDLSSFDTSNVTDMAGMFSDCRNTNITIGEDWNLDPASLGGTNITYILVEKQPPKVFLRDIQLATKELTDELYINKDEKGEADGVATLDENGKVPITQLPSALLTYEGTWNAATNTPELSNDTVTESIKGQVYICDTAGTWNGIEFRAGDWIICNGKIWQRSTADDLVKSVNGQQGIVELDGSNVKATYEGETDFINNLLPKVGKVKTVNEQLPDDQGNITVDGDNINVVYEEEEDTLNNTLPKLGKVKTVDDHEPDENGNIQLSWVGTKAEWEALDKSQLAGNGIIKLYFTDAETGSVVDKVEAGNMNPITSNAVAGKIDKVIDDANYFVDLPNGCYMAIGNGEKHSPNDGSGIHHYMTSRLGGWFTQLCISHGTGKAFIRNGPVSMLDTRIWVEVTTTENQFPNYTHKELIYNGTDERNMTYTAPANGWIICSGYGDNTVHNFVYVGVNGVWHKQQGYLDENITLCVPVRKGSVISVWMWLSVENDGLYFVYND